VSDGTAAICSGSQFVATTERNFNLVHRRKHAADRVNSEEQVYQLMRFANDLFLKDKETARRFLQLNVPTIIPMSPQICVEIDEPAIVSLYDLLQEQLEKHCMIVEDVVKWHYEKLSAGCASGQLPSHQMMTESGKEIQNGLIPVKSLLEWATAKFTNPSDFFIFRKQLCISLALVGITEYAFHFTRLDPDKALIAVNSGSLQACGLTFDFGDSNELGALSSRTVSFRLTPCLTELLGPYASQLFVPCMVAAIRALHQQPSLVAVLKPLLYAELYWLSRQKAHLFNSKDKLTTLTSKAVNAVTNRIANASTLSENGENKIQTLVATATSSDNSLRMNPVFHPWF